MFSLRNCALTGEPRRVTSEITKTTTRILKFTQSPFFSQSPPVMIPSLSHCKVRLFLRLVLQALSDQVRNAAGDGTANLFTHVRDAAQRTAENGEGLGHTPRHPHSHGDGSAGA